jgi:dolichol-phosphate mannosyltransferase
VDVSVVVAVYKCAPCLRPLHQRLRASLSALTERFEMVFVEDAGADGSWEVLTELARADPSVRAVRLSRNFGQHAAITAGLAESRGRFTVVMDCDLQDPPEQIARLHDKAREGYDIVFARRIRRRIPLLRRLLARAYFALLRLATGNPIDEGYGSFTLLSRPVVEGYLRFKDRHRHHLYLLFWLGFRTAIVEYEVAERAAGKSAYTLRALLAHALNGLVSQTTAFLRWIVYVGFTVSLGGLALAVYYLYRYFFYSIEQPGWTTLAVLLLVLAGMIMTTNGVAGLYIGKVFEQVKERPLFIVAERIGGGVQGK